LDFSKSERVLILAPHPDDELGCAGSVAKLAECGAEIYHWYFSSCASSIEKLGFTTEHLKNEADESKKILGINMEKSGYFDFPVRQFNKFRQEILEELLKLKKELCPTLVFLPSSKDLHQDHFCINQEGVRAFKNTTILGFELPWNMLENENRVFCKLSRENLDVKLRALKRISNSKNEIICDK
jgi:LmbE family N-acetylglucosaminyl deacetylase